MLELKNVCKTFHAGTPDEKKALIDITLNIADGDFVSIRQFDDYIHLLTGVMPSSCAALGTCGTYLVVEADGSLYPCDFYVLDEWNIGKISDISVYDAINSQKALAFRKDNGQRAKQCSSCSWFAICHGGCKKDISFSEAGAENYFCPAYKFFFEYASERLMEVARAEYQAMVSSQRRSRQGY